MLQGLLALVLVFSAQTARAATAELTIAEPVGSIVDWDHVLNPSGDNPYMTYGVRILGPSPYTRNATTHFPPASNTKLFTTGLVLNRLGVNATIPTRVSWSRVSPKDPARITGLTLIGSGDPTWGMAEFSPALTSQLDEIAAALYEKGVREVEGPVELVASDARWNTFRFPQGWEDEDKISCYGAQAQAFNMQGNCAIYVISGLNRGAFREPDVPVKVVLNLRPGKRTALEIESLNPRNPQTTGFRINGTWAGPRAERLADRIDLFPNPLTLARAGTAAVPVVLPVHNPTEWVRRLFRRSLLRHRILLREQKRPLHGGAVETLVFQSVPLAEVLKPFNKLSINHVGEALLKIVGQHDNGPGTDLLEAGQRAMREYVATIGQTAAAAAGVDLLTGFFSDEVTLWDGSGISRENSVTTGALLALLLDLVRHPDFGVVWDSLPIAGVDGTLRYRMRGTAAEGVLRAKTGTLRGVYNLAGFVPKLDDRGAIEAFVPFVALAKGEASHKDSAREAQDRLGAALAETVNPPAKHAQ